MSEDWITAALYLGLTAVPLSAIIALPHILCMLKPETVNGQDLLGSQGWYIWAVVIWTISCVSLVYVAWLNQHPPFGHDALRILTLTAIGLVPPAVGAMYSCALISRAHQYGQWRDYLASAGRRNLAVSALTGLATVISLAVMFTLTGPNGSV